MAEFEPERYRIKNLTPPTRFPSPGPAVMVGKVVSSAAGIAVGKFLLVSPVAVLGKEAEGGSADLAVESGIRVPVYLVGPGLPQTGDMLVCRFVDFRWVAERRGSAPPNPCGTTWPRVLHYRGSVNQAYAAFYFANYPASGPFPETAPYTLTYQPRPAVIPQKLPLEYFNQPGGVFPPYFTGMPDAAWFSDPIPITVFSAPSTCYFYLWMNHCSANVMIIDAPYGSNASGYAITEGAGNLVKTYIVPTRQFGDNPPPPPGSGADFLMEPGPFNGPVVVWGTHGSDDIRPDAHGNAGTPGAVTGT